MEITRSLLKIEENETNNIRTDHPASNLISLVSNPYIQAATSDNTRKAYRSDIRHFESWGGKLPATPEAIASYLDTYAPQLNARTLARRLIALRHWHTYQGFTDPTQHPAIKKIMIGITRTHGKPKAKARPITVEELKTIATYLEKDGSMTAMRDNALLQVGFFGALRRSELVAIQYEHIMWKPEGVEILIPVSKTDQTHEGQYCALPYGNDMLCPVRALKAWLEISTIRTGFIFRRITLAENIGHAALTPLVVNHILKQRAQEIGLNSTDIISSHSLRRGLATSAAHAGAPLQSLMQKGRWKDTNTVMEYIAEADRFTGNAAVYVLQTIKK